MYINGEVPREDMQLKQVLMNVTGFIKRVKHDLKSNNEEGLKSVKLDEFIR